MAIDAFNIVVKFYLNLGMTSTKIKTEIQKVLENVPESALPNILDFLKELQTIPVNQINVAGNLRQILSEDKELLEKLAQ